MFLLAPDRALRVTAFFFGVLEVERERLREDWLGTNHSPSDGGWGKWITAGGGLTGMGELV